MNTVSAKIVSISGRLAVVEVDAIAACARCAAGKGCGAGLVGADTTARRMKIDLPAVGNFEEGDQVELAISSSRLLHASILAYGLPLAGALVFTILGRLFLQPMSDLAGILLAVGGLVVGYLGSRRQLQKASCARQFRPEILARTDVEYL